MIKLIPKMTMHNGSHYFYKNKLNTYKYESLMFWCFLFFCVVIYASIEKKVSLFFRIHANSYNFRLRYYRFNLF